MTKDELKKTLQSAWAAQKQLEADFDELQRLRDNAGKVTPAYSLEQGGGSGAGQKLENCVVKIADMEAIIQDDMAQLVDCLREVRELIGLVDDEKQKLVLHSHYLNYRTFEQIAVDLQFTWRWVHTLHSRGLNKILSKSSC